jgi:outer membrane protein assembly factor BamB
MDGIGTRVVGIRHGRANQRALAGMLGVVLLVGAPVHAEQTTWPQFRGPDANPVSDHPGLPDSWSTTENVEWVTEIPGVGWSSPVVWGDRVFLTSATSEKPLKPPSLGVDFSNDYVAELAEQGKTEEEVMELVTARDIELPDETKLVYHLFCLDLQSGEILWQRSFHEGPPPIGRHRKNSYTSETPVTDGRAVYLYVASLGLWAYDLEGKLLWHTPLEPHKVYLDFGGGASPALHDGTLFILSDNEEDSFIAAFDTKTGRRLWRTVRTGLGTEQSRSGWSTPYVWENEKRTEVVTTGPGWAIGYDLEGAELWRMSGLSMMTIQSPFSADGLAYLTTGVARAEHKPVAAIRPGASGDITPPDDGPPGAFVAWYDPKDGGTYLPTPVAYAGGLYLLSDKGILTRLNAKTGERTYKKRIHRTARNFTASPWAYLGKIFCLNEEGDTYVIKAGEQFELLGVNSLNEFAMATPALVGGRLLLRTQGHLYSIRGPAPE